jgi:hypothetical protein
MATKQYDNYADLITFTRASTGTYLDSDGLLKTATTNVPRIEYDINGNRKGLLIEEARTNLVLYSEDFANAAWLKSNATVDGNIVIAPNGTLTGSLIYPTATSTSMHVAKTWVLLGFAAQSVYAKAAGKDFLVLRRPDGATANAWFNLSTGEVTSVSAGTASIVPVSNGWYRCTYVSTVPSTNNVMYISTSDANGSLNVTASGTDGIYIWGAPQMWRPSRPVLSGITLIRGRCMLMGHSETEKPL